MIKTFPNFSKLSDASLSKRVFLVLTGKEKKLALKTIKSLNIFDISWPASIVQKYNKYKIYIYKIVNS